MKKQLFSVITAIFTFFCASSCSDNAPLPEPEEPIFGTYNGTFTTETTYRVLFSAGGASTNYKTETKAGSLIFREGLFSSVIVNYRGNFFFTDSFKYSGNDYYLLHSGGGARTILFDTKMKAVNLIDSFFEKGQIGSPEDPTEDIYERTTITSFIGIK